MKLLKYTIASATITLLLTGCGEEKMTQTEIKNPDGTVTKVSIDSKQIKQGLATTTDSTGKVISEITFKDGKEVSGYKIVLDKYKVKSKDMQVELKQTIENGTVVKTENLTDLSAEHAELMYRYSQNVVLEFKYPTQKVKADAMLLNPQLLFHIKDAPHETVLKVIEQRYKGNVKFSDIPFGDLTGKELTDIYELCKKYNKGQKALAFIKTRNLELATKLSAK